MVAVRSQADSVEITTPRGTASAGAFVNCSGAWAAGIQYPELQRPPAAGVEPWKGRVYRPPGASAGSGLCFAFSGGVPGAARGWEHRGRRDGRAGTVFDRWVNPLTIQRLQSPGGGTVAPDRFCPGGGKLRTGLRPGTSDGLPVIGSADARVVGWRRDTFVTGYCWRRPLGSSCANCCQGSPARSRTGGFRSRTPV